MINGLIQLNALQQVAQAGGRLTGLSVVENFLFTTIPAGTIAALRTVSALRTIPVRFHSLIVIPSFLRYPYPGIHHGVQNI